MAQKQHFQAHKADGMCLLIGPVSFAFSSFVLSSLLSSVSILLYLELLCTTKRSSHYPIENSGNNAKGI